jgi:hypothetical protein
MTITVSIPDYSGVNGIIKRFYMLPGFFLYLNGASVQSLSQMMMSVDST